MDVISPHICRVCKGCPHIPDERLGDAYILDKIPGLIRIEMSSVFLVIDQFGGYVFPIFCAQDRFIIK